MNFSMGNNTSASTVEFSDGVRTATTSFDSFNLYDTNIFATFFYSDIERVWLMVVKSGVVVVNGSEIRSSVILCNACTIKFDTIEVQFKNMKDGIGLSQHLVEQLLASCDGQITQDKMLRLADESLDSTLILNCLRENRLFTECEGQWKIDYRNYIDFLEGRGDPLHNAVLREIGSKSMSVGNSRTFNINVIWNNAYFSGGFIPKNSRGAVGTTIEHSRGVPNWPHSAHSSSMWNSQRQATSNDSPKISTSVSSIPQVRSNYFRPEGDSFIDHSNVSFDDTATTYNCNNHKARTVKPQSNSEASFSMKEIRASDGHASKAADKSCDDPTSAGGSKVTDCVDSECATTVSSATQVELKEKKVSSLFNNFGIRSNHGHRKCYSVADGCDYLEGYRIWANDSHSLRREDVKKYFGRLKAVTVKDNEEYDSPLKPVVSPQENPTIQKQEASPKKAGEVSSFQINNNFNRLKMSFVENYIVDFAANDSEITFESSSQSNSETNVIYPFSFTFGGKQYVPRKRKSILLPVKRYKFYFMPEFSPKVHALPNFSSGVVVTSEYHSDGEACSDDLEALSRDRCHSKSEPRSFTGRDHDYDLVALVNLKKKMGRKYIS